MSEPLTCGEALVRLLERYDVDTVFGIPGTHTIELYRGLVSSQIRHVLVRHEQGAAFMADGYARVSGKPGVCFLIAGPGLMNAATGISCAYNDSIPMLVITSVTRRDRLGKGFGEGHEMNDQRATLTPMTGFSTTVLAPDDIPDALGRAFALFEAGRPRPVHIEVPVDVFSETVTRERFDEHWQPRHILHRPLPHPSAVESAADLLRGASAPVIYAGSGARHAASEVRKLAETLGAPVAHTAGGIGLLGKGHELDLGSVSFDATIEALEQADVLLGVGTEMGYPDRWYGDFKPKGKLIRVDIDPRKLTDEHRPTVAICADAAPTLSALLGALDGSSTNLDDARVRAATVRDRGLESLSATERKHARILETLTGALPASTHYFGDMCQLAYTGVRVMQRQQPGHFVHPMGFGCLGYGLPAALGAKRAQPDAPVVVITGDSGLLYTVQEMATALDESLPVIVVLWNNQALGEIRDGFIRRGIQPIAVTPKPPDNLALAAAFGWHANRVTGHDQFASALTSAAADATPSLIELWESDDF